MSAARHHRGMSAPRAGIDITDGRSIPFAPPPHVAPQVEIGASWEPVAVGPGRTAASGSTRDGGPNETLTHYPIQPSKVQRPSLREDTLARSRLLDWLATKIHDRVVLVLADAGYGKTTLLADFSQRTRLRTIWYRLDEDDRDWIAFLNYLVAAGREHDPGFAPTTASMLQDMSVGGPTRDAVIDVFLRELQSIAEHGAVLVLDDFHLVDESPDVRLIARELVARGPERLTIVFASRRSPTIPLARLRASGEVAELGTDDLRFDLDETRQLFTETYGRALDPDVLADVAARTEGWAASLQLVQAALRDRSPGEIRRFVRGLSGADQELYDYLAEEVVGDLPEDLQQFLMRTSILQGVTPDLAAVATGLDAVGVSKLAGAAERLTLLSRQSRSSRGPQRYHPLVREFLEARLRATAGDTAVAQLHRNVAAYAAQFDWRVAAHHYREAGDIDSVAAVVAAAIPDIMGSGQYSWAAGFTEGIPPERRPPGLNLVKARMEMQRGATESAYALSTSVLDQALPGSPERDHALLTLASVSMLTGHGETALAHLDLLRETGSLEHLRPIARGMSLMIAASDTGNLQLVSDQLLEMARGQRGTHPHYFGVSMLNLAVTAILRDDPRAAAGYSREAIDALEETSSRIELSAAITTRAMALMMLGESAEADGESMRASTLAVTEGALERADMLDSYSDPSAASGVLEAADGQVNLTPNDRFIHGLVFARYLARRGRHQEAMALISEGRLGQIGAFLGQAVAGLGTAAYVATAGASSDASSLVQRAADAAKGQGAEHWRRIAELLRGYGASSDEFSTAIRWVGDSSPWNVTFVADLVGRRLDELDEKAVASVVVAAHLHPGRWRFVLREVVDTSGADSGVVAARILESIGERADIGRLRSFARRHRRTAMADALGRALARRLADRVFVEDQNRVVIHIGPRQVTGSAIRRKVLALLCFLLTKPELAATRDQVLDALWPDLDPLDAVNSLNQTVYFLRRVLEEEYVDDLSPGYLHHDSDLIWLDRDLVCSRSNECRQILKGLPAAPSPDQVFELTERYHGRFALDFEYEEWAVPFRDWLHASFLEVVERALASDIETGHFERGIRTGRASPRR